MKYRHKRTGVIVDASSTLQGAWEPVAEPSPRKASAEAPKTEAKPAPKATKATSAPAKTAKKR